MLFPDELVVVRGGGDLATGVVRRLGAAGLPVVVTELAVPLIDVAETDDGLTVTAELPGMEDKDIEVDLTNNVLTLKGEKKSETEEKKADYHFRERSYGSFQRSIAVPFDVDPETVEAGFAKGVLTITLPRPPEAKRTTRRIEVKPAG